MREVSPVAEKLTAAGYFLSQGEFDKAEGIMNEIPLIVPQSSGIFHFLGDMHARHGDYRAAITNYSRAIQVDPTNHEAYHYLAALLLQTGDLAGYAGHRERILGQFGTTADPMIAERLAKDCLVLPPSAANLQILAKMADVAAAAAPTHKLGPYFPFVKGLAEYRQNHFDTAANWLQQVTLKDTEAPRTVQAYMVLAMAQYQLKRVDEARATLTTGLKLAGDRMQDVDRLDWNDVILAHLLMDEARRLVGQGSEPKGK
jgi:Flp pilus assembly protein TadD